MGIPIENIYYLLCYAWNKMKEKNIVDVNASDYEQLPDLLAKVLISGCNRLFKQGFDRNYLETTEIYSGIKGKLEFATSLKTHAFLFGKSICSFDEFSHNVLQNQLLKGTLLILYRMKGIDKDIKVRLYETINHFQGVTNLVPTIQDFYRVRIHRNNSFYDFLLKICRLIIEQVALDEKSGKYKFRDLLRDQASMQTLYEDFIRNFYSVNQSEFTVKKQIIPWKAKEINNSRLDYIPIMKTDISLTSNRRKILIDAKYYQETLKLNQFQNLKFHSENLYQIYSYLKNLEHLGDASFNKEASGILLYPTTSADVDETFLIDNHVISICTVNLASDWRIIEARLLELLKNRAA